MGHHLGWFHIDGFLNFFIPVDIFFPLSGGGGRESEEKLQTPGLSLSSPPTPQRRSPGGEEDALATAGRRGDKARSPHSEPGAGRPSSCQSSVKLLERGRKGNG